MPLLFGSDLELPRDPQEALHAATKQYVDAGLSGKAASSHTHSYTTITGLGTAATCDTGTASGNIPVLDSSGKLNTSVLPALAITDTFVVASQSAMLALTVQKGDVAIRTDENKTYILKAEPGSTLANWQEILTPLAAVTSVNGKTGVVILVASDIGAIPTTEKGAASGVATLDTSTKIPIAQIPTQSTVSNSTTQVPTGAAVYTHTNATSAHSATATPTASRIAMWDANARLKSTTPSATDDVATKSYVDTLAAGQSYRTTFTGSGTATTFTITHNLNSNEVIADVFKTINSKLVRIFVPWEVSSTNAIILNFAVAPPTTDSFTVKVRV